MCCASVAYIQLAAIEFAPTPDLTLELCVSVCLTVLCMYVQRELQINRPLPFRPKERERSVVVRTTCLDGCFGAGDSTTSVGNVAIRKRGPDIIRLIHTFGPDAGRLPQLCNTLAVRAGAVCEYNAATRRDFRRHRHRHNSQLSSSDGGARFRPTEADQNPMQQGADCDVGVGTVRDDCAA